MASPSPRLHNPDLAPAQQRSWGTYSVFAMWMSDVHSVGTYTFAAGLFFLGLAAWQVLVALVIGILVVFGLMNLTGFAGQRTGAPFPVIARISFGVFGANLPALIRALVAIAWYGIQTWLASTAVVVLSVQLFPGLAALTRGGALGLSPLGWAAFGLLWVLQLLVIRRGMETIRKFQDWAGPAIWGIMAILAIWIGIKAGSKLQWNLSSLQLSGAGAALAFAAAISLTIAYFSTLLLNFCDFSRFTRSRRTVVRGNFLGLPLNFLAFAIVTVVVTGGSMVLFGKAITDPIRIVAMIHNPVVTIVGALAFTVATIGVNVVANFVSPAYDLANVAPRHIDFKRGGLISAVLALLVTPWNLYSSPVAINYFLGGLGAFLGPLFGVIFADYYLRRRQQVDIDDLYSDDPSGRYHYRGGWNPRALGAFAPAALISAVVALVPALHTVAAFSWPIGVVLGGAFYLAITRPIGLPDDSTDTGAPAPQTARMEASHE
ncbi:MAG: NCS1 family nucleobase:cation symporter-1 [Sciscionella sp.]